MGDLDVNLIREFARRPGFYDRSNPFYKDKLFTDRSWEEISAHLGYGVPLLKDRMLQLRNRYNLEKRRLDNLEMENPNKVYRSPWPLYSHLSFLSNHIRTRRSYKTMMTRSTSRSHGNINPNESSHSSIMAENDHSYPCPYNAPEYHNGNNIDVKHERCSDSDTPAQNEDDEDNEREFPDPAIYLERNDDENVDDVVVPQPTPPPFISIANQTITHPDQSGTPQSNISSSTVRPTSTTHGPSITVRNGEFLKRRPRDSFNIQEPCGGTYSDCNLTHNVKRRQLNNTMGHAKFETFGKFLSTSLCELPEQKALTLLEKFTSEIVLAFRTNENTNENREEHRRRHHSHCNEHEHHSQHNHQQVQHQQQQPHHSQQPQLQPHQQQQQQQQPNQQQLQPIQQNLQQQQQLLSQSNQQQKDGQQQEKQHYKQAMEQFIQHVERQQIQTSHKHKNQGLNEIFMTINT